MNYELLEKSIKKAENISLKSYLCPKGRITIGYGRNLEDNGISQSEADLLLRNDILNIKLELEDKLPIFNKLDDIRQNVLIEMAFNMGVPNLLEFKNTIKHLQNNDFKSASEEMLNSKWHKDFINYDMQDGKRGNSGLLRSEYLSKIMKEGKY